MHEQKKRRSHGMWTNRHSLRTRITLEQCPIRLSVLRRLSAFFRFSERPWYPSLTFAFQHPNSFIQFRIQYASIGIYTFPTSPPRIISDTNIALPFDVALLYWDYMLTFQDETKYIWSKHSMFKISTLLYICCRYALVANILYLLAVAGKLENRQGASIFIRRSAETLAHVATLVTVHRCGYSVLTLTFDGLQLQHMVQICRRH